MLSDVRAGEWTRREIQECLIVCVRACVKVRVGTRSGVEPLGSTKRSGVEPLGCGLLRGAPPATANSVSAYRARTR